MKKTFCLLALIFYTLSINAQLKVGNNPKNLNLNAILEIESTNKGILFPRLALTQTSSPSPLTTHVQGMIVFNISKTNDVDSGLYYNNGSSWIRVGIFSQDWTLKGNSGTNSGSNFIGTTDTAALVFKTQNTERLRILNSNSNGSIGVGVSNPYGRFSNSTLDVVGTNGVGIGPFKSMNWVSDPQNAYIASFANTNLSGSNSGHGVLIKVASNDITTNALDISQNSSISAAGNPILIAKGNGNVGIGNSSPSSQLHVTKIGGGQNTIFEQYGGSLGTISLLLRAANGSLSAPAQTLRNDQIISLNFQGHNGTNFTSAGGIYVWADSNFTSSSNPTRMSFFTGNLGSSGSSERIRINSNGNVGIGINPTSRLDINGDLKIRNVPTSSSATKKNLFVESDGSVVSGTSISKIEAIDVLAKSLSSSVNISAQEPPSGYATQGTEVELTSLTTPFTTIETLNISVNALLNFAINVSASMSSPWQGQLNARVYLDKGTVNEKSVLVTQESMKFLGTAYANDYTIPINVLFENITAGSHVLSFTVQRANETQTDPSNPFGYTSRPVTPSPNGYLINRASYNALVFKRL